MLDNNYIDMSIEEIEALIHKNSESMSLLKKKLESAKKEKTNKYSEMLSLMDSLAKTKKEYSDYKIMLRSPYFDLTNEERETIEGLIPIYEEKIKKSEDNLKAIKPEDIF